MSSRHKDNGVSAYQPIRSKSLARLSPEKGGLTAGEIRLNYGKHEPIHTKAQFKKRRKKNGDVKIIRVR